VKRILQGAAAFIALIPGVGIFLKGWAAPSDYKELFGGIVGGLGVLAFLIVLIGKPRIKNWSDTRVRNWCLGCATTLVLAIGLYIGFYRHCVIVHEARGEAFYPLWITTGSVLERRVMMAGGRYNATEEYGIEAVRDYIRAMPNSSMAMGVTIVTLLIFYQAIVTSLVTALGIAAAYLDRPKGSTKSKP
jgi:hypothetical protein